MDERTLRDEPESHDTDRDDEDDSVDMVGGIWGDWGTPPVQAAPSVDAVERFKDRLKRRARERQGKPGDE